MRQNLPLSIIKTLTYSDIFDYPLKTEEIHKFLSVSASQGKIKKALRSLLKDGHIINKEGYWALKKREGVVAQRKERERIGRGKLAKAQKVAKLLSFFPTVSFVGVSGALSCLNAPSYDDIDFFVVTKPSSVWLTRLLTTILLDILRARRRRGDQEFKDKICLNMFISEDALSFRQGDLYLAREIVQLRPLFDRNGTYRKLIEENKWWLSAFLPNFHPRFKRKVEKNQNGHSKSAFYFLELILREIQIRYMDGHKRREILESERILFHPKDTHYKILTQYDNRIRDLTS